MKRRGKKGRERVKDEYLNTVMQEFSGYIAADELYDGPFCVLSIVDNRSFHRLIYEVFDHSPTHEDLRRFFRRFQGVLKIRGRVLQGVTTDGSPLYPAPLHEIFGNVTHQICTFHTIAEITKAILKAVSQVRRELRATLPRLKQGRPGSVRQRKAVRYNKRLRKKISDLFDHRYLFVQHDLTPGERKTLTRITRGRPQLRALRQIMEAVYRLFDRRCRTATAWMKLAKLRRRVSRFKKVGKTLDKIFSPNLEKALTFLDDRLLPATSNAVERGNRRYRKMQQSVYRVRSHTQIERRVALDMLRDDPAGLRAQTTVILHQARAG